MLEQGVTLPQAQLAWADGQQLPGVLSPASVKDGRRGGVVTGIEPQCAHHYASGVV